MICIVFVVTKQAVKRGWPLTVPFMSGASALQPFLSVSCPCGHGYYVTVDMRYHVLIRVYLIMQFSFFIRSISFFACTTFGLFGFFLWDIPQLQSDRSRCCDHRLDYAR